MAYTSNNIVRPGQPPLIWSDIDSAFRVINQNFVELYATIGGGSVVDFSSLSTNVSPSSSEIYDLGSSTKRWRDLWLSGSSIHLGGAVITATGTTVNLPVGSTIGGLRVDENYFKYIAVDGQTSIEADEGTDTLTIAKGNGINLTTDADTDTLTITNSGVLSLAAGTAMSVSSSTGNITVTNTGVTSAVAGLGISVSSGTGAVTINNGGIVGLDPGFGIDIGSRDPVTGRVTVINTQPNIAQNTFSRVAISGQDPIIAGSTATTLGFESFNDSIQLTTNTITGYIGFTFNNNTDIVGSVFADNSTMLVDGTNGLILGPFAETVSMDGGAVIDSADSNFEIRSIVNFNVEASGVMNVITDSGDAAFQWQFGNDGILTAPGAIIAQDSVTVSPQQWGVNQGIYSQVNSGNSLGIDVALVAAYDSGTSSWGTAFITTNSNSWQFAPDATLTLPNGQIVDSADSNFEVRNINNFNIEADNVVKIITDAQGTAPEWQFDGVSLYTPVGSKIVSAVGDGILIKTDGSAGPDDGYYTFNFDAVGNLSVPGDVSAPSFTGFLTGDVKGSVFADDSSLLVDAVNGEIPGYVKIADLKTALQDGAGDYAAFKAWVLANL